MLCSQTRFKFTEPKFNRISQSFQNSPINLTDVRCGTAKHALEYIKHVLRTPWKKDKTIQTRMKDVASLANADVIVFVNNTQLNAADQPHLQKAPPYTQRDGTRSAIQPQNRDLSAISCASSEARSRCNVDAAAITNHPIIHHKHRHGTCRFCNPWTHPPRPAFSPQHPLPLKWKITWALIHDEHSYRCLSLQTLRRRKAK